MSAQDRNSYADVWDQLDAKYAERVRVTDAAALGDEEIVRRWPQIGEGYLSKCLTALSLFTDASNSKPQLWVKDPVVGREVFPGIYRSVTVDVDVQKPGLKGIIQTLRKGFATTPQWAEARLEAKITALSNNQSADGIAGTTSDPVDRVFDVLFPNCSPLAIDNIAGTLRVGNYSGGITVRGELHSGAWHVLSVSTKLEDDGSASAILRVATPQYTISAYDDYGLDRAMDVHYVMDVPKEQAQGIVNAWKAANPVGASATVSYSRDQKLVDIILRKTAASEHEFDAGITAADCRYSETETIYLNVADADFYPIGAPPSGLGISYTRNVTRNINGTWDITIKTRTARYRDSGFMTVEESAAQQTTQRQQLGLTSQSPESVVPTAGAVLTQRVEIRDDCSKDVTTVKESGKAQTSTARVEAAGFSETTTEKTVQVSPAPAPVQVDGHIKTARTQPSKYHDRYDTTETDREVKLLESVARGGSALFDEEVTVRQNDAADLSAATAGAAGEIIDRSSRKNDAGRFDNSTTKRTAKPFGPATDVHGTPLVEEKTEVFKNQDEFPSPGIPADGTIIDVSGNVNEAAKIDYAKTTRRAIPREVLALSTGEDEFKSEKTDLHVNKDSVAVTRAAGEVVDASIRISEFGKLDATVRKSTAKPVVSGPFTEHDDGYKKTTKTIHRNVDSVPAVTTDDNGHDISVQVNEHGKNDVVETKTTVRPFSVTITEPSTSGKYPGFKKIVWGLSGAAKVQPEVDAFVAQVAARVDEQYHISCGIDRDENGFYVVTMSANPKESGGSVQNWDQGIDIDTPKLEKRSTYKYVKYTYKMTSNRMIARNFLHSGTNPVEGTEAVYIGRGRYKACLAEGSN